MTYILVILFVLNGASLTSVVAEFGSIDACWSASDSIRSPFDRDRQWRVETVTTCVPKGDNVIDLFH